MIELLKTIGAVLWCISALAFLGVLAYSHFTRPKGPTCTQCRHYGTCVVQLEREGIPFPDYPCADFEE
ncbi:hypothetical protein GMD88_10735 [Pseudoflavonifractor sp. BIOML-A6]|nr:MULTISPECIES: hypothetical protein [unclassified Pseudoflavonifractor]MTQ97477.1 hypothetical protein [Pseudoflavonifractor sp. BIOML-A16]MTR06561.1 hypothetical protein [Pseudoflavonifractor sp. BIOML-A15]MTR31942.1 hypothetical protein [Pseudoflavonifractor sp. BIOML-A14]MTR74070.1 hypothetical protein [Pseudoflavonifractor sp. BIOML-A18]MTS64493.1 hypothetical protein [Pseudoflavonifractor sp. BIOML-A5]MTS72675.1 hypothetical protein [Pseudoflavonifractor sp. BIOML-A8]MTS90221.1 hypoth